MQVGSSFELFLTIWGAGMVPFFFGTLEEYHTGALILRQINGPIEGLLLIASMHLATYFIGPHIWHVSVQTLLPALPDMPIHTFIVLRIVPVLVVVTLFFNIYYMLRHLLATRQSLAQLIGQCFPFAYLSVCGGAMFYFGGALTEHHALAMFFLIGALFAILTADLILAYLCKYRYSMVQPFMAPLAPFALCIYYHHTTGTALIPENTYLYAYLAIATLAYAHRVVFVVLEISAGLRIPVFTVPHQRTKAA